MHVCFNTLFLFLVLDVLFLALCAVLVWALHVLEIT